MQRFNVFCRTLLLGAGLTTLIAASARAQSFHAPTGSDNQPVYFTPLGGPAPATQAGVVHTGTDVVRLRNLPDPRNLQVMVWDNAQGQVTLSWGVFKAGDPAVLAFPANAVDVICPAVGTVLSDPDVAMSYVNGVLYADVIYIASIMVGNTTTSSQTWLNVYEWDPAAQVFNPSTGPYPAQPLGLDEVANLPDFSPPQLADLPIIHSSPNIDANDQGVIGVVWQESLIESGYMTWVSPSYPPPGKTSRIDNVAQAQSFFQIGTADGKMGCGAANDTRGILISTNYNNNDPNTNPQVLFSQTLLPDVAVTTNNTLWLTYINSSANQSGIPIKAGISLVLKQVNFDICQFSSYIDFYAWPGVSLSAPRIAASPTKPGDVEVVKDAHGVYGGCESGGNINQILNYGRSNGGFRPNPTVVNNTIYDDPASEPVVAFYGYEGNPNNQQGDYIVSWTGASYPNGSGNDVWARSLRDGDFTSVFGDDYSRVNSNAEGPQRTPSVAARYLGDPKSSSHLFYNEYTSELGYKTTPAPVGTPLARPTVVPILQAYPNPFSTSVDFRLSLHKGEVVQSIQVTDLSGRVLDTVPASAIKAGEKDGPSTVSWQPGRPLQIGSYMVRITTNERTSTLPLSKQ